MIILKPGKTEHWKVFLEALGRYAEDIQGYYDNNKQSISADVPSWQTFANMLKGATLYE